MLKFMADGKKELSIIRLALLRGQRSLSQKGASQAKLKGETF